MHSNIGVECTNDEQVDCVICLEPIPDNNLGVVILPCLHRLHCMCYASLVQSNTTNTRCPICREIIEITSTDISITLSPRIEPIISIRTYCAVQCIIILCMIIACVVTILAIIFL